MTTSHAAGARPWTGREVLALSDLYARGLIDRVGHLETLAKKQGRTLASVAAKAHELRLTGGGGGRVVAAGGAKAVVGGRRADLDNRYFRSSWEANYARFLNWSKIKWEYEAKTFRFEAITRGTMSYTPDFWLPEKREYHEVKGWMDQQSRTALKRMAKYFPGVKVVVIDRAWFAQAKRVGLGAVIPGWEGK